MNDESERFERKQPCPRHHPGIRLEGLRRTTKELSQDSRSPGQDLKPGSLERECQKVSGPCILNAFAVPMNFIGNNENC
jgi:hypothetical protein